MSKIITTDQEWRDLDLLPSKPPALRYDPFEIFNPGKSFLREVIKQLKHQCYAYTEEQDDFARLCNAERHEKLLRRIRDYEWRLRSTKKGNTDADKNSLSSAHILQAKQSPISDWFNGNLRKAGKDLVGLCPFHQDKHASFTIYREGTRWHCFGACGIGGDVIDFISKLYNLSFIESIKFILHA